MTTDPYTPDEFDLLARYTDSLMEASGRDFDSAKTEAKRGIAKIKAEAWDEAIDFVYRHYDDYLPHRWEKRANKRNPYREEEETDD